MSFHGLEMQILFQPSFSKIRKESPSYTTVYLKHCWRQLQRWMKMSANCRSLLVGLFSMIAIRIRICKHTPVKKGGIDRSSIAAD